MSDFVVAYLLPLVGTSLIGVVIAAIFRPRFRVVALRAGTRYYVEVHYVEDDPLWARIQIILTVKSTGHFTGAPRIICGPPDRGTKAELDSNKQRFVFSARVVRPRTTWSFEAEGDGQEGNLIVRVAAGRRRWTYPATVERTATRTRSPYWTLLIGLIIALIGYCIPFVVAISAAQMDQLYHQWNWQLDGCILVAVFIAGLATYLVCVDIWRRRPAPIARGYLGWETKGSPIPVVETPDAAAPTTTPPKKDPA